MAPVTTQKSRILAQSQLVIDRLSRHKRAAASIAVVSAFGMVAAFAVAPDGAPTHVPLQLVVERLATPQTTVLPASDYSFLREELVQRGDTLADLLSRLGINDKEAFEFIRTDSTAQTVARQLRPGKSVAARTTESGQLLSLHFPLNGKDALLAIERNRHGGLTAKEDASQLETRSEQRSGEISYTLFGATDSAGIPDGVATQLADIFGGDIDFHRDLRKGDRFSVVYEMLYLRGQPVRSGRILAAEFTNNQKVYQAYWYAGDGGKTGGYYGADGKNLRKAFLRSPLEFSRVTSGFTSNRFHPVLQTWRAHKGVDYGAPIGTRVRSVADGTVEFAGSQGGYGNLVVIRHHGAYSTAYGHLNGFAPGLKKGMRVAQGEMIGYVGKTGLASGPHLHYEFRIQNQQVNPLAVTLPSAPPLSATEINRFLAANEPLRMQIQLSKEHLTLANSVATN